MKYIVLLLLLFFSVAAKPVFGQTGVIDSLRTIFLTSGNEKEQLKAAILMLDEYESLHTDTIARYYQIAETLQQRNFSKENALQIAVTRIRLLRRKTQFEAAMLLCDSSMSACADAKNSQDIYRKLTAAKSAILTSQFKYKEALDVSFNALKKAESEKDDISQIFNKITIGWINMEMGKNREALHWLFDAITHSDKIGYTVKKGTTYANISAVYAEMKQADSAEFYIKKAFDVAFKHSNLTVQANCHYIFSDIMVEKGNIAAAEKAMNEGLQIRKKIGDPYFFVSDLYQLAIFYATNQQPQKGIAAALEGIAFARKSNLSGKYLILYDALAQNYKAAGDADAYSKTLEKIISLKDSLYKNNSAQSLAEMQTKYDVQKKETLIAQQQLDLLRRSLFLYGGGAVILLLLAFLAYRFKKYQRRQKQEMEEKRKQNEAAVKEAEEKERKRIAAELHDNLGVQANAILHNSTLLAENNPGNTAVLTDLQDTAKEMLHNLRETLWAMKTADITATDLWLRIINFMKQMSRHYTSIHFKIEGEAPADLIIASNRALNMVLIVQEAVNNAVKHAAATEIKATGKPAGGEWNISITDNGGGFDTALVNTGKTDSYGLGNMQERAAASAIKLSITSSREKGTTVQLQL
jgi:two-component system, NarL family, sensor kinase